MPIFTPLAPTSSKTSVNCLRRFFEEIDTMLFTPFRDKRLLKLLECSSRVLVNQVTDGKLSKIVIEHFNSNLLNLLDKSKNQNDPDWFWQKSRTLG